MKSGIVYRGLGAPDRDNTLVYISDGLKRVVVRDSKIEKIEANNAFRTGERFQLVQPMAVHGGLMPKEVISVEAGPWNDRGRRSFRYVGSRSNKPIRMEQAIIEIGPHIVKFRGVDGFWVGQVETNQVPRSVVTSLLGRVEQNNVEERERVVRFLMDIGWHAEAKQELDRLVRDFPQGGPEGAGRQRPPVHRRGRGSRSGGSRSTSRSRRSNTKRVASCSKIFKEKGMPTELQIEVREIAAPRAAATRRRPGHGGRPAQARRPAAEARSGVLEGAAGRGA